MALDKIWNVEDILPHRSPFLFVSRIIALVPGEKVTAEYDVPPDLPIFQGHFPSEAIFPGVIVVEMMAQSGGVAFLAQEGMAGKVAYLAGIDGARLRKPVRPGDTLRAEVEIVSMRRRIGKAVAKAYVGDEEVASATLLFGVPN